MDRAELAKRLSAAGLNASPELLAALARPAVGLRSGPEGGPAPLGATKLGGLPDVTKGFAWPQRSGRHLNFLGQLNLAELAPFDAEHVFPARGLLSFFFYGQNHHAVVHLDVPVEGLERAAPPEPVRSRLAKIEKRSGPTEWVPRLEPFWSLPLTEFFGPGHPVGASYRDLDRAQAILNDGRSIPETRVLGYPISSLVQEGYEDRSLTQLLQVYDHPITGEDAVVSFCISSAALARGDFSETFVDLLVS